MLRKFFIKLLCDKNNKKLKKICFASINRNINIKIIEHDWIKIYSKTLRSL